MQFTQINPKFIKIFYFLSLSLSSLSLPHSLNISFFLSLCLGDTVLQNSLYNLSRWQRERERERSRQTERNTNGETTKTVRERWTVTKLKGAQQRSNEKNNQKYIGAYKDKWREMHIRPVRQSDLPRDFL